MMAANVGQYQMEMVRNLRIKKLTIKKTYGKKLKVEKNSHIFFLRYLKNYGK